jgi:hypothetical protein
MDPNANTLRVPWKLEHRHGLNEWVPMLPERGAEVASPEAEAPTERLYRCQRPGCTEVVRVGAEEASPLV